MSHVDCKERCHRGDLKKVPCPMLRYIEELMACVTKRPLVK